MVVSVAKATSAEYYTSGGGMAQGAESYYLDAVAAGEPAGQWSGSGAARLGLAGEVEGQAMHTLYGDFVNPVDGLPVGRAPERSTSVEDRVAAALASEPGALPERIDEIRRQVESRSRTATIGWDATFSVPKSVTVAHTAAHRAELAAIRSGDADRADRFRTIRVGIEDAIGEANAAMLAYAETLATSRTGGGSGVPVQWTPAPGLTVASFRQHTNRNIDPQLHVHNVIFNRAFCDDGKARALDGQDLLAQRSALGAVAERVMEERLTALGFTAALRPDQTARELSVIPEDVAELFSSRSRQVTARVAELVAAAEERVGRELTDLELYRLKSQATLASRAAKHGHPAETREEMIDRWAAETPAVVGRSLDSVADAIDAHLQAAAQEPAQPTEFSPDAIIAEAVAACGEQRSTWGRANLMLEISRRLPSLGGLSAKDVVALLDRLTDQALAGEQVVQVSGHAQLPGDVDGPLAALADDPFTRPSARLYAAHDALVAEIALRQAALTHGRYAVDANQVGAWLDAHCPTIGADQRAAVEGVASSDAALTMFVGPAGTGKSYAAGAFAGAWQALTGGRVVGLAVSQVATMVLRDDGIESSRNITQWLQSQDRIAEGSTAAEHVAWRLGPRDVVMVDEASMVATRDMERIRALVDAAGARLVVTGDPHQLGAVEAGGVMGLLDGHAETYTLADVRRFNAPWERAASLDLRARRADALSEYDRHGRIVEHTDMTAAVETAATAAVADRVAGRSTVIVCGTNDEAASVAARVRARLVDLGLVEEAGVLLGRDGCTAGVGDVVACRQNDFSLSVTNRVQYRVSEVGADGTLTVEALDPAHRAGGPVRLPAAYVAEEVQLGYASTVHAAQGLTVEHAQVVTDGGLDAAALYVAMTRGSARNTVQVVTRPDAPELPAGLDGTVERPSGVAVLEGCLERDESSRAATVEQEQDHERLTSMALLAGRAEVVTRQATRERLERHLDELAVDGMLSEGDRARLCADDGCEHLARLLRAVEQAGDDPREVLRTAVAARGFGDAGSIAQVISHRITGGRAYRPPVTYEDGRGAAPADISEPHVRHLAFLAEQAEARREVLGARAAADPPAWAIDALGPVPPDGPARAEWQRRAGAVAGHREATGWTDEHRAIGSMPGLSATERRASFVAAWEALGRPEANLHEAEMSDGRLRVRVRAAETEEAWAPPHADDALRSAETAAENARLAAALADAQADAAERDGDVARAAQLRADAERERETALLKARAAEQLTEAADARGRWAAGAAVTLDCGARARKEAETRGLDLGHEPDRVTAEEWLAADRAARQADDAHRRITETDLHADDVNASFDQMLAEDATPMVPPIPAVPASREAAHERLPGHATAAELDMALAASSLAITRANDHRSAEASHQDTEQEEAHAAAAEADRRRRDAADELATHNSAATASDDQGDGWND